MIPLQARLFVVTSPPRPGDLLDHVALLAPELADRYRTVVQVTPESELSLRGLARIARAGLDRILFDFTRHSTANWAKNTAMRLPGAILCGPRRLPLQLPESADLRRSGRRYRGVISDFFSPARIGALEAHIPGVAFELKRMTTLEMPARDAARDALAPQYDYAFVCAADGAAEAYGTLGGWHSVVEAQGVSGARGLISVATTRDLDRVHKYCQHLGCGGVDVVLRNHRADLLRIAQNSAAIIDLDRFSWDGVTEACAAARFAGVPSTRVTVPLSDLPDAVGAVLRADLPKNDAGTTSVVTKSDAASVLAKFIERACRQSAFSPMTMRAARGGII